MPVRAEYMLAADDKSPYYTTMRTMASLMNRLGEEGSPQSEPLPDGWLVRRFSVWESWSPREWSPRIQGWKIHVSTTPEDARETLARTTRVCVARDVAFKFLYEGGALQDTNGKQHDRGGSGKFITIYPDDDEQLAVLLAELEEALTGQKGPYILSDLRYGEAPVYVRYGAIMGLTYPDALDRPVHAITGTDTTLIDDHRKPRFIIPDGVVLPACLQAAYERSRTSEPSRLRDYKAVSPLHFSNAGGVYKATLPDGTQRVLREARSNTGLDARGRDAVQRQREEEITLRDMTGVPGVQQLISSFWAWEHRYLELDYVEGRALTAWVVRNSPFHGGVDGANRVAYARRALKVGGQLISIIESIHARGWAIGDLHPGNVLVSDDDEVTVIDFEDATRVDEERLIGFRVFEYCAPDALDAVQADWYAISRSLMLMYVPDWEIEVIAPAQWANALAQVERDFGAAAADQIRSVVSRFRTVEQHAITPAVTVEPLAGNPGLPTLIEGLVCGMEWSRQFASNGGFPGDPAQEGNVSESFGYGRAGAVWAFGRLGHTISDADLEALAAAVQGPVVDPGLYTGRAGIALALAQAGRWGVACEAAGAALAEANGRRRLDLFGGRAGVILAAVEVAQAAADETLLAEALAANERLQRSLRPGTQAWTDITRRRGYYYGLTGLALTDIIAYRATGEQRLLERAVERVRAELDACITTASDELMVRDVENNRALPYIEWGSAGVWAVAMLAERLGGRRIVTRDEERKLLRACSSDIYVYNCLDHGRAGIMAVLAAAGPEFAGEVDRQCGQVVSRLLRREDMVFTTGDGLIRLSSDVSTGAAGLAVALHAVDTGEVFNWLPVTSATAARFNALPLPQGPHPEPLPGEAAVPAGQETEQPLPV